jgi:hypothetical protein
MTEARTDDYREMIRELVEEAEISEEAAHLRVQDADLWLLHPGARFDDELQGEEGVRLWEEAVTVARTVADSISNGPGTIQASPAITQLAWDAAARAEEALERARDRVSAAEDVHITPTIIHRAYAGPDVAHEFTHGVATVEPEPDRRALIVFRSQEEAEKYRAATGKHPKEEGFRTATLDLEELGHILEQHECAFVAMPEPWTEDRSGGVDFFAASDFIGMLEGSTQPPDPNEAGKEAC